MNKIYNPPKNEWSLILERPTQTVADIEDMVNSIFLEIKKGGDAVIAEYTEKFDGAVLGDNRVTEQEINTALGLVPEELKS
ncbi:MAG TPA: histidinol dehydrogenase, partial [Arenibacter sp.]|nr:histidinol dehydrogenase [Arenibacter sp.]